MANSRFAASLLGRPVPRQPDFPDGQAVAAERGIETLRAGWLDFALASVSDAVLLVDEHAGLHYVNEACCRFFGYPAEELLRLSMTTLAEWPAEMWAQQWCELQARGASSFEGRARARDGRVVPVRTQAHYGKFGSLGYALVVVRDASERRRTMDELLRREHVIGSVLENSPDIIVRYDLQLRRIYANPCYERLTGLTPAQYLGRTPSELSRIGAHAHRLEERLRLALDTGEQQELDFEWCAADGSTVWHGVRIVAESDADGRHASVLTIASEITARKRAEQAMAAREREFLSLAENSPDSIARYDRQGRRLYVNAALRRRTQALPLPLGQTPAEGSTLLDAAGYRRLIDEVIAYGEPRHGEFAHRKPNAGVGWADVRFCPEFGDRGEVETVLCVGRDITERKRTEDAWRFITQAGWGADGESFFALLASYLGRTLQVDHAFVGKLDDGNPEMAETVALYAKGEIVPNLRYALKDTPSENVMGRSPCCHRRGVQQLFPHDRLLADMQVESYAGVPLLDAAGRAIGLIAVMHGRPLADDETVTDVLRLVAARAAAQLERDRSERALQASEREFRSLAENSPDHIVRYDAQGRMLYANPALTARLGVSLGELISRSPAQAFGHDAAAMIGYREVLQSVLRSGESAETEIALEGLSGETEVHHVRFAAVKSAKGGIEGALAIGRDITQRRQAEEVLRRHEQEFRALVERSPDLIERYDRQGRRVYANPALRALVRDSAATSDEPQRCGVVAVEADRYLRMVHTVLATGRTKQAELRYHRADGSAGWLDARLCPEADGQGGVASVFVVARDITQGVEQRERIKALALSDPLTRLHNRQALYDYAPGLISEARRHGRKLGVLVLDVDRFKDVNDTLGHAAGDALLCEVAQRIADCTRGYDLLVRLGGDEFAIIASNLAGELGMAAMADKIDKALCAPLQLGGRQVVVSASIGIALFPADGEQLEDLMAHADAAMYQAKRGGRSRYEFYRPAFSERARDRLALEQALRAAQDGDGLELHYQPLVSLRDGCVVGAEALLRWRHPELGLLPPDRFIAVAEETGLIVPIGRWVIDQAAHAASRWNRGRATPLKLAVNVSTRQFLHDDVGAAVRQAMRRAGCQPQWLGIEVTENLLLEDSERVQRAFGELRAIGLQIAIDDFGTGYSALNYLGKFDVDCLKIDRQFVRDIDSDPRQAELVKAFIGIARALKLSVVAEGVESPAQASFLLAHGCDVGQGYLFCRPASAELFEQGLREGRWEQEEFTLV